MMKITRWVSTALLATFALSTACANGPTSPFTAPEADPGFTTFPNGKTFADFKATLVTGTGEAWTPVQQTQYENLKHMPVDKVQWALMDLDQNKMISQSTPSKTRIFGASTSKIFVASALLDKQKGEPMNYPSVVKEIKDRKGNLVRTVNISDDDFDHLARIYMHSDNDSWILLQLRLGKNDDSELDADRGRLAAIEFSERMGYRDSRVWQGDLLVPGSSPKLNKTRFEVSTRKNKSLGTDEYYIHGNEITAADTVKYLHDTYTGNYAGAEYAWKMLYTCQTGEKKGNKYLPKTIYVGGKTGTFPNGGFQMSEVNLIKKKVSVRNHAMTFLYNGHQYGLVVLTDLGNNEPAAVLAGGLVREFLGIQ